MKATCLISGVSFDVTHFGRLRASKDSIHPIFSVQSQKLFKLLPAWSSGKLSFDEEKLLLLAFLYKTELVTFTTTARPSKETVTASMESLAAFCSWYYQRSAAHSYFPKAVVSMESSSLSTLKGWLEAWNLKKKEYEQGYAFKTERRDWERLDLTNLLREAALEKLITSPYKDTEDYAERLANWAMVASRAPKALHSYWVSLFCATETKLANASSVDIRELLDHLEENLDATESLIAIKVLQHVRKQLQRNLNAVTYLLGGDSWFVAELEAKASRENPEAEHELEPEPRRSSFTTLTAFVQAHSSWILKSRRFSKAEVSMTLDSEEML